MSKRIALCVGLNRYRSPHISDLQFAVADAEDVARVFGSEDRGAFDSVRLICNEQATRARILDMLADALVRGGLQQGDMLVLYFAGHAQLDRSEHLVLLTHDTEAPAPDLIDVASTVHMNDLEKLLDNADASHVIIILDTCFSGASGKVLGRTRYRDNSNLILIGASRSSEPSTESKETGHGHFTEALLRALEERPDEGEWITLHHALQAAERRMRELGRLQTMEVSSHVIDQRIALARNPKFSIASHAFLTRVRALCEASGCEVVGEAIPEAVPNLLLLRERLSFSEHKETLVLALNNQTAAVMPDDFAPLTSALEQRRRHGGAPYLSAIVVSQRSLPLELRAHAPAGAIFRTAGELERSLMRFDRYLARLVHEFEKGDASGIDRVPLKDCYIEVNAQMLTGPGGTRPVMEFITDWLEEPGQPLAILFGEYGTGKTTFCRKLAYDLSRRSQSGEGSGARIPLIFPLRRFPRHSTIDFSAYVVGHLKQECQVANPDFHAFSIMNEAGLFTLIFDGFDEMAVLADRDVIQRNFDELMTLCGSPDAKVLITSRPELWFTDAELKETLTPTQPPIGKKPSPLRHLKLLPLTREQIEHYLVKRLRLLDSGSSGDVDRLRSQIQQIGGLDQLIQRPVLLEMTVRSLPQLLEEGGEITRNRLYETYLAGEIERQQRYKRRDFLIANRDRRLELIGIVARAEYAENPSGHTATQIQDLLRPKLSQSELTSLEAYVRDFIACSFLVREGDRYRFSHRSFLEHLVAKAMAGEITSGESRLLRDRPLVPTLCDFLVELLSDQGSTVRKLLWGFVRASRKDQAEDSGFSGANALTLLGRLGEHLSDLDLSGLDLESVNLSELRIERVSFRNCILTGANFSNTMLVLCHFTDALLDNAAFVKGRLLRTTFRGASLNGANLTGVNAEGARFQEASLLGCNFETATVSGTEFRRAILKNARFVAAELQSINFDGADLGGANLSKASCIGLSFPAIDMTGCLFSNSDLTAAKFRGCNLQGASLAEANLSGAWFEGADLRRASLWRAKFEGVALQGRPLEEYVKRSKRFRDAVLEDVEYSEPVLPSALTWCFPSGTCVRMADGSDRPIEGLRVGDRVLSFCEDRRVLVETEVREVLMGDAPRLIDIDDLVRTTPTESLFTDSGWIPASRIAPGDQLYTLTGAHRIRAVTRLEGSFVIHSLGLQPYHGFFANGVLAHNSPMLHKPPEG